MERSRKKKYSVIQVMFVVIQLIIYHKKERVEWMVAARGQEYALPLPGKSTIHMGPFSPTLFFFIEALFRLAPLTKISVVVHGRDQTRCCYCNKGNTNTMVSHRGHYCIF